jgi:hypothetical protein
MKQDVALAWRLTQRVLFRNVDIFEFVRVFCEFCGQMLLPSSEAPSKETLIYSHNRGVT